MEVSFPGMYKEASLDMEVLILRRYIHQSVKNGDEYSFVFNDFLGHSPPPNTLKETADSMKENFFLFQKSQGRNAVLTKEKFDSKDGIKFIDLDFEIERNVLRNRIFFVNGYSYKASVLTDKNLESSAQINEFYERIKFEKPKHSTED